MIEIWLFLNRETPHMDQTDHGTWRNFMIIVLLIPCWLDGSGSNTSDPSSWSSISLFISPPSYVSYPDLDPGFETEDDDTLSDSGSDEPD